MQPARDVVGDLCVIQIAEQEVGVALDADFGQVDEFGLPAVFVDGIDKLPRHRQFCPFIFADIVRADFDVVTVIGNDGKLRQFFEIGCRHSEGRGTSGA